MKLKQHTALVAGVLIVAIVTRVMPHYPNVTALGAAALFGGAFFSRKWALALPVIALFISDLVLNNLIYAREFPEHFTGFTVFRPESLWVYGSFILIAIMGMYLLKKTTIPRVAGASVLASLLFFIISNFGVWIGNPAYPLTFSGLITCYTAAIPFFWNTLFGDLFYVAMLFGSYGIVSAWMLRKEEAREEL